MENNKTEPNKESWKSKISQSDFIGMIKNGQVNIYNVIFVKFLNHEYSKIVGGNGVESDKKIIEDNARVLMHRFFSEHNFNNFIDCLQIETSETAIDDMVNLFIEDDIRNNSIRRHLLEYRNQIKNGLISELEKSMADIKVDTSKRKNDLQKRINFVKKLNYNEWSKHNLYEHLLLCIANYDSLQLKEYGRNRKSILENEENFTDFIKVYKNDLEQGGNHTGIINDYEVKNCCKNAVRDFHKKHYQKIVKLYPNAIKLTKFLNCIKLEDIPKLFS